MNRLVVLSEAELRALRRIVAWADGTPDRRSLLRVSEASLARIAAALHVADPTRMGRITWGTTPGFSRWLYGVIVKADRSAWFATDRRGERYARWFVRRLGEQIGERRERPAPRGFRRSA
jgi:hypothetical protein